MRRKLEPTTLTFLAMCAAANAAEPNAIGELAQSSDEYGARAIRLAGQLASREINFDIPAQPLTSALLAFSAQSGLQVITAGATLPDRDTRAISGRRTIGSALSDLLTGTGLKYQTIGDTTVTLVPAYPSVATTSEGRLQVSQSDASDMEASGSATRGIDLEEIVVTAQKRIENLQSVPVPVTVINADALASNHQLRLEDYYKKIPGLSLALWGSGSTPVIAIRGITTGSITNPTVGVVIDDVSYGATVTPAAVPTTPDIDPFDLARVEVLRGPQGTLYGASSIGGLLKFMTVDPEAERVSGRLQAGSTSVRHGDDFGYSVRGAVNVPVNDSLAVRASGFTTRDPGYVDNIQTGAEDVNQRDSDGGRLSALWRASESFSVKLSALIQNSARLGTEETDSSLGANKFQQRSLLGTGTYERDSQAYSATMTGKIGRFDLVSATGYSVDEINTVQDFPGLAALSAIFQVDSLKVPFARRITKLSQELRASMPLGARFEWLLGAFYTKEVNLSYVDWQATDSTTGTVAGSLFTNRVPSDYEEYAAFTNLTVDITDRLDIQFGGRVSENKQGVSGVRTGIVALGAFGSDPSILPEEPSKDTAFTYLITPRLKMPHDVMLYARLASGYRPGGPNVGCGVGGVPCTYKPDTTRNYEIGVKGEVPGWPISIDASLYHIDWSDIQITLFRTVGFVENASRARSRGAELSVETKPLRGLTLSSWVAWNDAELTEDFPLEAGFGSEGERLPYSSRISGNFSVDQEFPLWNDSTAFVGGSLSYVGERQGLFNLSGAPRETFPSYTQLDLHSGLRYDSWTINAFVNNLTDERGVLRGGLDSSIEVPTVFSFIQPRTIGLSLTKTF